MSLSPTIRPQPLLQNEGEDLSRMLKGIVIPPRPAILDALLPEMRSENPNLSVISKLISKDVGLTTGVLRVVNAPFFGLSRKISSVENALNMLGMTHLSKLVTGILVKQAMTHGDLTPFWETAEGVANIAGYLASRFAPELREDAYTFGLLQNVGVALIMQKYADYDEIEYQAETNQLPIIEVEEDFYETNHATLGYILARSWNLSPDLCQAILRHHDVTVFKEDDTMSRTARRFVSIGTIAMQFHDELTKKTKNSGWEEVCVPVLRELGINPFDYQEIRQSAAAFL